MTDTLTQHACAKINLTLDVGGRRADGYHDIRSVMQTIALHDTLVVLLTPDVPGIQLTLDGDQAKGVPADERNIIHQAAVRMQKIAAARGLFLPQQSGLRLHLTKRIPSEAGLGGGSSDAAACLRALNTLFNLHLPLARLAEIAQSLGADVPFFLTGGTALVEGLGERITPLPPLPAPWPLAVVKPNVGMSTPAAYAALDALPSRTSGMATEAWLSSRTASEFRTANDFEAVVFAALPPVRRAYDLLVQTTGSREGFTPHLCGSGSALFCRLPDDAAAHHAAQTLRAADIGAVWVTHTLENSHDPFGEQP